jgi:hypothetical protein
MLCAIKEERIMMDVRFFLGLFLALIMSLSVFSQENNEQENNEITWRDRLFFGGCVGLQIGSPTIIELAPQAGYRITSRLSAGIGAKYEYYKNSRGYQYETSVYGGNVFSSCVLWKNFISEGSSLLAHAEYEALSLERKYFEYPDTNESGRFILNSFLVGGGMRQRIGRRSYLNILILWNLNETTYSPYQNPILRVSFQF